MHQHIRQTRQSSSSILRPEEEVFLTYAQLPGFSAVQAGGAQQRAAADPKAAAAEEQEMYYSFQRAKRHIAEESRPLYALESVGEAPMLPQEPLSERVADLSSAEGGGVDKDTEKKKHKKHKKKQRRRRKHMKKNMRKKSRRHHKREKREDGRYYYLSPFSYVPEAELSSRIADEDLYDLFVDYFETPRLLRTVLLLHTNEKPKLKHFQTTVRYMQEKEEHPARAG